MQGSLKGNKKYRAKENSYVDFTVPKEMADVIKQLQEAIMFSIAKQQIAIECCPTSNVKIARLLAYENHPILRLHPMEDNGGIRPAVSVNTDDLGVFVTSADNEYALMTLALMKKKGENGKLMYNSQQINNWLETIIMQSKAFKFA